MATIATLATSLTANVGNFEKGFNKANKLVDKFSTKYFGYAKKVAGYGATLFTAAAGTTAYLTKKQYENVDAQAKLAKSLNTTVQSILNLERAGELAGVSMGSVEQATKDLYRRLSQAADGTGPAGAALSRLRLDAAELLKLPLDERISKINAAILKFIPAAQQAAVAGQLFGEEGSIAMARLDPGTIEKAIEELALFGAKISEIDAQKIQIANDKFSAAKRLVSAIAANLAIEFAPALGDISDKFVNASISADGFGEISSNVFGWVVKGAGWVSQALRGVQITLYSGVQAINYFGLAFNTVLKWINQAIGALVEQIEGHLNQLISVANKVLPKSMEIALFPSDNYFKKAAREWEHGADYFSERIAETRDSLADLMEDMANFKGFEGYASSIKELFNKLASDAASAITQDQPVSASAESTKQTFAQQIDLNRVFIGGSKSVDKSTNQRQTMIDLLKSIKSNTQGRAILV